MPPPIDVERFAALFQQFLEIVAEQRRPPNPVLRRLVERHLGRDPAELPVLAERLDAMEHPNLQLALDALLAADETHSVLGLPTELRHYSDFTLAGALAGRFHGPAAPSPVEYVNVPIDVDRSLPCAQLAIYLLRYDGVPVVVFLHLAERHGPTTPGVALEVLAAEREHAEAVLVRLRELMSAHNVYRGKVLGFRFGQYGDFGLKFHQLPRVDRDDVVLPTADLAAIERHTLGVAQRADALRSAGRHLKRGLLLYGPPGTGKTLSVMYLCSQLAGRTVLLLSGRGVGAVGQAMALARGLQPAMVVLEDVDLVAMERTMPGMESNPVLFELLNELDGLDEDADVIFVLTTNRVELLEPALAARPGRIDQAVEIRLPDADSRERLLQLYLRGLDHELTSTSRVVERTAGVSAAFLKELVRRATLVAVAASASEAPVVTDGHLDEALDDLLEHSTPILRSILGARLEGDAGPLPVAPPTWHGPPPGWAGASVSGTFSLDQ